MMMNHAFIFTSLCYNVAAVFSIVCLWKWFCYDVVLLLRCAVIVKGMSGGGGLFCAIFVACYSLPLVCSSQNFRILQRLWYVVHAKESAETSERIEREILRIRVAEHQRMTC